MKRRGLAVADSNHFITNAQPGQPKEGAAAKRRSPSSPGFNAGVRVYPVARQLRIAAPQ